ncbi:hypothetical protein J6590_015573 [Homalodisca vitripennis]|nr:hypothetical protein J6590_015573 [Homalodisca vitripennis]
MCGQYSVSSTSSLNLSLLLLTLDSLDANPAAYSDFLIRALSATFKASIVLLPISEIPKCLKTSNLPRFPLLKVIMASYTPSSSVLRPTKTFFGNLVHTTLLKLKVVS